MTTSPHSGDTLNGLAYEDLTDELGLIRPVQNAIDEKLIAHSLDYSRRDALARESLRASTSADGFHTLLTFARRAAVFAVRNRNQEWISGALAAIAWIDLKKVDFRDVLITLTLVGHAASVLGLDAKQCIESAAKLAEPNMAELILGFTNRPAGLKHIESMGYAEVTTPAGFGFVRREGARYEPSATLTNLAIEIADCLAGDNYRITDVLSPADFQDVWLQSANKLALQAAVRSIRGCAAVHGLLKGNSHKHSGHQLLFAFVVALQDTSSTQSLLRIAHHARPQNAAMTAAAAGPLFCLIVARAMFHGMEASESQQSIQRLAKPVEGLLRKAAHAHFPQTARPWWQFWKQD